MYIKRTAAKDIKASAQYAPVVAILGPRQSGKTTLARHEFPHHKYINLEALDVRKWAKEDPRDFLAVNANKHGLILDEFQEVPDLLSYIQVWVDEHKAPGYFILTGSQNFLMNQTIAQSLAGRIAIHTLLSLCVDELHKADLLPVTIEELLYNGCYPRIYAENAPPDRWYADYIKTYVERDIRHITKVTDLDLFQTFVQLCAGRTGQLINFTSLGNDCGISATTAQAWITLLQASYIVFLLRPHHNNYNKVITKSPKLYFYDSGLVCSLLKITPEQLPTHYLRGGLFEGFVISEFYKSYTNLGKEPRLYFWRDKTGNEIDCLIEEKGILTPIENKIFPHQSTVHFLTLLQA